MRNLLVFVMLVFAGPLALAAAKPIVSAQELQVSCTSNWGNRAYYEMYAACRAYVSGVADALAVAEPLRICPPDGTDKGRLTEAVIRAFGGRLVSEEREASAAPAQDAPRPVSGSAAKFVAKVLTREFPCQ